MAKTIKSGKYVGLRKLMALIILTCFVVFVLGQVSQGVSAKSLLVWASILMIVLFLMGQVLLKIWSSWEDISDRPQGKRTK
jgi:hypothetical protein